MALPPQPSLALVRRELVSTLRGVRTFLILLFFVAVAILYAGGTWPGDIDDFFTASYSSRSLIRTLVLALFGGTLLFVPAFAANAIVLERERATYDFLRLSMIRPSGVVLAKLLNAIGVFLILYIALLPVFAVSFFLVGVDPVETLRALGVLLVTTVACASAGLAASSVARRGFLAIGLSYVGVIALMLGPLILTYIVMAVLIQFMELRSMLGATESVVYFATPAGAMWSALYDPMPRNLYLLSLAYPLLFTVVCLAWTHRRVRIPPVPPRIEEDKPIDDEGELRKRRYGFPFYLIDPLRRKKAIEDRRNPMMVRELRWGLFNRGTILVRVFYVSFVFYFFTGALVIIDPGSLDTIQIWILSQIGLTVLVAPALMSNAFTKEYELGNMDMLRVTLLQPRELVVGKLTAGVGSMLPLLAAALLSCVPVLLAGEDNYQVIGMGYSTLGVCAVLSMSIGLLCSMFARRTSTSLALSYAFGFVFFGGIYLAGKMIIWWWIPELYEAVGAPGWTETLSPITAFWSATAEWGRIEGEPLSFAWWAGAMCAWLAVSGGLVAVAVRYFSAFKMRDP